MYPFKNLVVSISCNHGSVNIFYSDTESVYISLREISNFWELNMFICCFMCTKLVSLPEVLNTTVFSIIFCGLIHYWRLYQIFSIGNFRNNNLVTCTSSVLAYMVIFKSCNVAFRISRLDTEKLGRRKKTHKQLICYLMAVPHCSIYHVPALRNLRFSSLAVESPTTALGAPGLLPLLPSLLCQHLTQPMHIWFAVRIITPTFSFFFYIITSKFL